MSLPAEDAQGKGRGRRHLQLRAGLFEPNHCRRKSNQNPRGLLDLLLHLSDGGSVVAVNLVELGKRFGVTRHCVRRWLGHLADDGYVVLEISQGRVGRAILWPMEVSDG